MENNTRIKTDIPPCERGFGCCHGDYCHAKGDKCAQFTSWQATGFADFNLPREPKGLIKEINKIRKGNAVSPAIRKRQAAVHGVLASLNDDDFQALAMLSGYSVKTLKANRFRGLAVSFIEKMESAVVINFFAKHGEAA